MIACRSDSLHLWIVGTNLDTDEVQSTIHDLEHAAWHLSTGTMSPPGSVSRADVNHLWSGLQFLREALWVDESGNACVLWGLLWREGRLWAVRAGTRAQLDQLTGPPLRPLWHSHGGEPPLEWCELAAGEVWRLTAPSPEGPAHAHYRPELAPVPADPAQIWETAEKAERAERVEREEQGEREESRGARRRRRRRERLEAIRAAREPQPTHETDANYEEEAGHEATAHQEVAAHETADAAHETADAAHETADVAHETSDAAHETADAAHADTAPPVLALVPVVPEEESASTAEPDVEVAEEPTLETTHDADSTTAPENDADSTTADDGVAAPAFLEPTWAKAVASAETATSQAARPAAPRLALVPRADATPPATPGVVAPAPARIRRSTPWQRWFRSLETRRRIAFAAAALGLAALACLAIVSRRPIAAFVEGRFEAEIVTQPAGATIVVDGEPHPTKTPVVLELPPGEHKIELRLGEFAQAAFTIEGERDGQVRKEIAWLGSLGVASADTSVRLAVALDGKPWGQTPLWRDELPVGRHRLSFEGPGVRPWEEEVLVRAGQSTRIAAQPVHVPPFGLVTASAEKVTADGVEDVEGAAVYVDSERSGVTPLDLKLPPGPHSIRIVSNGAIGPVHRIDVQAGARYFASTQFGRPPEPEVVFELPKKLSLAAPPRLTFALKSDLPLPVRQVRFYVQTGQGAYVRYDAPLTHTDGRTTGNLAFPVAGLVPGAKVSFYAVIETREGEEYSSEVRRAVVAP